MSYVTHLEAAIDGARLPARTVQTVHAGRPLLVRYDLERVARRVSRSALERREKNLWRYRELLPVEDDAHIVSLGEGGTPLLECPRLAAAMGVRSLAIKDEAQLPTGSFKSRGMAVAVSMAVELGVKRVAIPTAGNAGGALAAYAARAGIEAFVFMPEDTPIVNRVEAGLFGARVFLVNGLIHECAAIVRAGMERMGWFDMSTLKEPYRLEGKKTMGLELAEQSNWTLPDVVLYPTGGGTGLIGMWKAFDELEALGWLDHPKRPRMFSCQSQGCAPIADAFDAGLRFAAPVSNPRTSAAGVRVPVAVGDFMILDAVRASNGRAMSVPEERMKDWMALAASTEGVSLCPESALCLGVLERARAEGHIGREERVVLFNTGAAQKYVEVLERPIPHLDRHALDWSLVEASRAAE
jgi:threonine synthase